MSFCSFTFHDFWWLNGNNSQTCHFHSCSIIFDGLKGILFSRWGSSWATLIPAPLVWATCWEAKGVVSSRHTWSQHIGVFSHDIDSPFGAQLHDVLYMDIEHLPIVKDDVPNMLMFHVSGETHCRRKGGKQHQAWPWDRVWPFDKWKANLTTDVLAGFCIFFVQFMRSRCRRIAVHLRRHRQ